jgi:hypothetical protein
VNLRAILTGVSWAVIVIMPLVGLSMLAGMFSMLARSAERLSDAPVQWLAHMIQYLAPSVVLALLGVGVGLAGLLLVSIDRRLERFEDKS